ncbi:MAG: TIGR04283 family arsenosugar biosynthesis glycosyltransferase [Gammaproteobacteria bacterium]|nr:TIGR04283 family arsenosugar biosynthesis glycosyltransferase [Gammaproteobacteria bacterium]
MKLSIVIPVLGEEPALGNLLERLGRALDSAEEIIVVDGARSPDCREQAEQHGAIYVASDAGRGRQLARGADAASGELLWFLHADAEPPGDGARAIRQAARAGAVGGYFRFRFTGSPRWHKSVLQTLINWRTRIGVPYGDQGLFARADAYRQAGGFPDQPLFEEVPLIRALRRQGRFHRAAQAIGVSPRRWERDGWLRRSLANRILALGYLAGISPGTLARHYRPIEDSKGMTEC